MKCAKDMFSKTKAVHLLDSLSRSANTYKTAWIDTAKLQSVQFLINVGASAAGSTASLVECDSTADADATAVAAADYDADYTAITGTSDDQLTWRFSYHGAKRYVAVNLVHAGTSLSSCDAIVGFCENEPIAEQTAAART